MIKLPNHSIAITCAAIFALSACAGSGDRYPSLAEREIERVSGTFPVADTTSPTAPDAAAQANMARRIDALLAGAQAAHGEFIASTGAAEERIIAAQGSEPDSRLWADAHIALADLDSQRSQSSVALAELDLLHAEGSIEFAADEAVDEARGQISAQIAQQDGVLARLRGLLPGTAPSQ